MSWGQDVVNVQVSVNRAVFEMNRRGMQPPLKAEPRNEYILQELKLAAQDLNTAIKELENQIK